MHETTDIVVLEVGTQNSPTELSDIGDDEATGKKDQASELEDRQL